MQHIAKFFLTNYKFTIVLTLFVMIFGVGGLASLNSESFPSVNIGSAVISTRYDGATAEDIETKITKPIEEELQKVSGVKVIKSVSQAGVSTIVTEADIDKYDTEKVIADLQRAVDRASGLPTDLLQKPTFLEIKSDEFPVIELAVIGSNKDRLRDSVADLLREDLQDNKKVSTVTLTGFRERRFNIFLDQQALLREHVPINAVQLALAGRNITVPGGEIKSDTTQKLVRIEGKALSREELENLVVRSNFSGNRVLLKNIARIEDGGEEAVTLGKLNGTDATFLTITKKGGTDLLGLAKEIEDLVASYGDKYKGQLQFQIFNNEGVRVVDRLNVLISNGWQGLVLVLLFLLIFLPGRIGVMTAISLPLAMFATFGAMMVLGYTLNTITIIALVISIGMLVDNSVVISENFARLRSEGLDTDEALLKTIRDLWAPITATALTTVGAFFPMLVTTGVMGQFIKGIPIVVSVALLLSLVESFILLPTRLKLINHKVSKLESGEHKKDLFDRVLTPRFEKLVGWAVDNKWSSLAIFTAAMMATFSLLAFGNKVNLFPADQTEVYIGRLSAEKGTRLETTNQIAEEVVAAIKLKMGDRVKHISAMSGDSQVDPGDPKAEIGTNVALVRIFVTKETQDKVTTKEVLDTLRTIKNPKLKSLSFEAQVNGPPVGDPVTVTFRSSNAEELGGIATKIKDELSKTAGIFDAKVDDVFGDDEVLVQVDFEKAARLGLSLQDVGSTVRTAIAGQKIGDVNLNNRNVDYYVRMEDQDKARVENLGEVKIEDRSGNLIPLKNFASFETRPGSPQIKRYDLRRAKTVTANLDDSIITSIQANALVKKQFEALKSDYPSVTVEFGGESEKTSESVASLMIALILSLIAIFALLVLMFSSYLSPLIILTTIPLGLIGVSFAFFIHGKALSFMALIGIIGLGGIIVNSGIILISLIEQMKAETSLSLRDVLVRAASLRLRSVLVSSLTTISGLVPTAYGIGGVDYFIIPMALALAWGLTTGTIFTLIWVPPAYAIAQALTETVDRWTQRVFKLKLGSTQTKPTQTRSTPDAGIHA